MSRCDLHVLSRYSKRPPEWILRRLGVPESYTSPDDIYRRARASGMDFVTITDRDSIQGALSIADRPGAFVSAKVTTMFPDGARAMILVWGLDEGQFREIEDARRDIFALRQYLHDRGLAHGVAHPLHGEDGRLSIEHFEKLLLLFEVFEACNGLRSPLADAVLRLCVRSLTPEAMARLADRHGIDPIGETPWRKSLFGGSEDRGGLFIARAYTEAPPAEDFRGFLSHVMAGRAAQAGEGGAPQVMASGVYSTFYHYIKEHIGTTSPLYSVMLSKVAERFLAGRNPAEFSFGDQVEIVGEAVWSGELFSILTPGASIPRSLAGFFSHPALKRRIDSVLAEEPTVERRSFRVACEIGNYLGFRFFEEMVRQVTAGDFLGSLQSASALVPVAVSVMPYFAAFLSLNADRKLLERVSESLLPEVPAALQNRKRAWLTDTLEDVNGVARTIRTMVAAARAQGFDLTVVTSRSEVTQGDIPIRNFAPVGEFELPEYKLQKLSFPPILEMLDYIHREGFTELIISTPGPVGLVGLAAAKMFGLPSSGIYHTDFPQYVKILSDDHGMETLTWNYMHWFYDQMDTIYSNSRYYRDLWVNRGISASKLQIFPRGLDTDLFDRRHRDTAFWSARGARGKVLLYVGRISKEKDLDMLPDVARVLAERGAGVTWAFVGEGPYREELALRMPGAIFTGVLTGAELGKAYASSDLFVFPSTTDTYGNVIVEACAAGLRVVVSDAGGPKELVRSGVPGIVCPARSVKAFADAIQSLLVQPAGFERPNLSNLMGWDSAARRFWNKEP
ncbi:MAG TPA: glycosyltransferase [Verrucomicrobiae bacterium]|nr:glycosyltransferase [Verrucomicrobiae bacterium]